MFSEIYLNHTEYQISLDDENIIDFVFDLIAQHPSTYLLRNRRYCAHLDNFQELVGQALLLEKEIK